jgi:ABC-type sugar transport system ATPase subunit
MKGITKYIFDESGRGMRDSGVKILDNVEFNLKKGEVHVLVGENGAGKSTLMKILSGIIPYDEGQILLNGKDVTFKNVKESRDSGISFIHQELNLCPKLDIGRNMFLGREPKRHWFVDTKKMYDDSRVLMENLGLAINPKTIAGTISVPQQQVVEIAKALSYESKIIIMDEPTASLTKKEISMLFDTIKELKAKGLSIIYISHRLEEIGQIGDRISVLRDGRSIKSINIKDYKTDELIQLMVGRSIKDMYHHKHKVQDDVVLEVKGFQLTSKTKPVNFKIHRGEIVGMGGLVGAGRTEVAKSIYGAMRFHAGEVIYLGGKLNRANPKESIRKGIVYLSEDRKTEGLVVDMSIGKNITMASLDKFSRMGLLDKRKEMETASNMSKKLNVISQSLKQIVKTLSGGNQQRVVIAKWLVTEPKLLILDEPTRGIDVGAKAEIYEIIDDIASQGMAVLLISSELPELIGMSDRIIVMKEGSISGEISIKSEMTQENILAYTL